MYLYINVLLKNMEIIITENRLKTVINTLILERLGVPDSIMESAEDIYNKLIEKLKRVTHLDVTDVITLNLTGDFTINDYKFKKITFFIETKKFDFSNNVKITQLAFGDNHELKQHKNKFRIMSISNKEDPEFVIEFAIPTHGKTTYQDIVNLLIHDKTDTISSFSHELTHAYETYMSKSQSPETITNYSTPLDIRTGIRGFDEYLYGLYYLSNIEQNARVPQIAAKIKYDNITKKNFQSFLNSTEDYKVLKRYATLTYDDIYNKIKSDMRSLNKFIINVPNGFEGKSINTDDEKVNAFLYLLFKSIINYKGQKFVQLLKMDNPFFRILPEFKDNRNAVNDYFEKLKKNKNYKKYFESQIKMLNLAAQSQIKKIDKLFDMAKNDETENVKSPFNENTNPSIKDWELYHKLKETEQKTKDMIENQLKNN